ncbi:retron system putative HNH endonuclease [Leptolyngbya boryana CZ1]|uniref:Retron system putative HNH endonuclease n=1 Tax=Leptolyngbya boryana CZ1 TaxID=3060204 RepID=A0AA97AQB6_LEPBY|nr:retron system putative HNH endonuclease [Leptolyngbya boryana]WNZ47513.1 retron system putative HNH endonuclease [Leptolyngbya boryana CZ1]
MRPVDRGLPPRTYTNYQHAQADLVERLGEYCSYCERRLETHIAVEHIQPKSRVPALCNDWSNFLLSCVNCNSCKKDIAIVVDDYFWPHRDNTLLAFDYLPAGMVVPHPNLTTANVKKAQSTITLLGLDREPGRPNFKRQDKNKDKRWQRRLEAWELAQRDLQRLNINNSNEVRELIVEHALAKGMFSIWLKVFENDSDMKQRLISSFKGTAMNCFDASYCSCTRPGGNL